MARTSMRLCVLAALVAAADTARLGGRHAENQVDAADPCAGVEVLLAPLDSGKKVLLEPRADGPVKMVDFVQFGSEHELPELYLRLAEHGDFIDELHVVEADRTWTSHYKGFVFEEILAKDPELAKWRDRTIVHKVKLPESAWGYDVQHAMIEERHNIPHKGKTGVLLEGDLDEIVSRPVLRAMKNCVPKGSKKWDAHIAMNSWKYNFGWTTGLWIWPPIVSELNEAGLSMNASGDSIPWLQAVNRTAPMLSQLRAQGANGTSLKEAVAASMQSSRYVIQKSNSIVLTSGKPAGWHLSWFLDGSAGIAYKYKYCFYPQDSLPHYIKDHMHNLDEWIKEDFLKHPNFYDGVKPAKKEPLDMFPEALSEQPEKFKLFIDGIPK